MTTATTGPSGNRILTIALWIVKVLLALAFAAAGFFKLSGQPMMVDEFAKIGFGQGFRYLTGAIELVSAILIVIPRTALVGALGLCGICAGAFIAQIGPLHGDVIHTLVLGGLAAFVAWFSRPVR